MNTDFYGTGIGYPLQIDTAGGIREAVGVQKVEASIRIILGTQYGERLMRPNFGCNLKSLAFAPNNETTASLARYYVTEGLRRWEPRINVLQVLVTNDNQNGLLLIDIHYQLRGTQEKRTLFYSFPLEAL